MQRTELKNEIDLQSFMTNFTPVQSFFQFNELVFKKINFFTLIIKQKTNKYIEPLSHFYECLQTKKLKNNDLILDHHLHIFDKETMRMYIKCTIDLDMSPVYLQLFEWMKSCSVKTQRKIVGKILLINALNGPSSQSFAFLRSEIYQYWLNNLNQTSIEAQCVVCHDDLLQTPFILSCSHATCPQCIHFLNGKCAMCRTAFNPKTVKVWDALSTFFPPKLTITSIHWVNYFADMTVSVFKSDTKIRSILNEMALIESGNVDIYSLLLLTIQRKNFSLCTILIGQHRAPQLFLLHFMNLLCDNKEQIFYFDKQEDLPVYLLSQDDTIRRILFDNTTRQFLLLLIAVTNLKRRGDFVQIMKCDDNFFISIQGNELDDIVDEIIVDDDDDDIE